MRTIVWFRGKDLRIADHAPLGAGVEGGVVIPLFVLDPFFFSPERAKRSPHGIQFLLESLSSLARNVAHLGSRLVVVAGESLDVVPALAERWKVDRVVTHRSTEPFGRARDRRIEERLRVRFDRFEGETLLRPGALRTKSGVPYSVFTPFARAFHEASSAIGTEVRAPSRIPPLPADVLADEVAIPSLEALGLDRNPRLLPGGEAAGRRRLRSFLAGAAADYHVLRDRLDVAGTSRLSVDLRFGVVSPRTVWNRSGAALGRGDGEALAAFQNELVWREFAFSTLWDRPELLERPFRAEFASFPWREDEAGYRAWAEGRTGYPVVDAAARQLLAEGFVHNRARMIAASFLTKHLMISYQRGEAHYLQYLTDGDWAPNNMGWQWSAGCGVDAQPYFRIFNPVTQGTRFDPEGDYVRRWVPELARLPSRFIHRPWEAPASVRLDASVRLGVDYPAPIVDHDEARARYLAIATSFSKET